MLTKARSCNPRSHNKVDVDLPEPGVWYAGLFAFLPFESVGLAVTIMSNRANGWLYEPSITADQGEWLDYRVMVPPKASALRVFLKGNGLTQAEDTRGSGDADLYIRRDASPTLSDYDYRPWRDGSEVRHICSAHIRKLLGWVGVAKCSMSSSTDRIRWMTTTTNMFKAMMVVMEILHGSL